MSDRERLRRADPERTGPIRDFTTYFRDTASWNMPSSQTPDPAADQPPPLEPGDDPVAYGVALGYQVVEEHIRQGYRAAHTLRNGTDAQQHAHRNSSKQPNTNQSGADLGDFLTRAVHLYQDAGSLVLDVVEQVAQNPRLQSALSFVRSDDAFSQANAADAGAVGATAGGQGQRIGVELITARPAQARAELHGASASFTPMLDELRAPDKHTPPLTGIQILPDTSGNGIMLQVKVPDEQPAGIYSGLILDAASGEPRGTLCVRLSG